MAAEDPSVSGVSGRYATALFELARDEKSIDAVRADLDNKICQPDTYRLYCQIHASLRNQTALTQTGTGVPLVTHVAILSEGLV